MKRIKKVHKKRPQSITPRQARIRAARSESPSHLLQEALHRLQLNGSDAALEYLRQHLPPERSSGLSDALVQLARTVRRHNPQAALAFVEAAIKHDPDSVEAWLLRGNLQDRFGQQQAAAEAMLRVIQAPTATPEQILRAAHLLSRFEQQGVALQAARTAYEQLGRPLEWATALLYIAQRMADWDTAEHLTGQMREAYAQGQGEILRETPRTHLNWCGDETLNVTLLQERRQRLFPIPEAVVRPEPEPLEGRRLRIGYLSSDFREHPTARLIQGLLRQHDRRAHEVVLYCSGWNDGSPLRAQLEAHVDQVHSVSGLADAEAAALIRAHRIDVLVELNGPTRANRLGILVHRPAPVQIGYLGWPGSYGGELVDYIVADSYVLPTKRAALYPEPIIRLAHTYQINDYAAQTRPSRPERQAVGLPGDARPVLGMFNAITKVNSAVWSAWMQILQAVPRAVLWILDPGPGAAAHLASATKAHGVALDRVVLAPRCSQERHLARLQCCDLILDTWPYGGHTSTSDALFAGVPVVALEGTNFASRVSGSLLRAAGLEVFVQPDVPTYVRFAVSLLRGSPDLARARAFLAEKVPNSDVFNAVSKARQLEWAYRKAIHWRLAGTPLQTIQCQVKGLALSHQSESQSPAESHPVSGERLRQKSAIHKEAQELTGNTQVLPSGASKESTMEVMPSKFVARLCIVTTCKQRLHHLKRTLPLMVEGGADEVIVVDYGCPQGTGDWVKANYPEVKVVNVCDDPGFNVSRARNLGAAQASGDWLVFIDADISIQPEWIDWQREQLDPRFFYRAAPVAGKRDKETWGTCICPRRWFERLGGYDEAFRGWGGEDDDLYRRLVAAGVSESTYPSAFVRAISHSDEERLRYYKTTKSLDVNHIINHLYIAAKQQAMQVMAPGRRPLKQPSLAQRQAIMAAIHKAVDAWVAEPSQPMAPISFQVAGAGWATGTHRLQLRAQYEVSMVPIASPHHKKASS